jgi:UDP:flavonoid glycosyltransferase YjiC (YdhE family)
MIPILAVAARLRGAGFPVTIASQGTGGVLARREGLCFTSLGSRASHSELIDAIRRMTEAESMIESYLIAYEQLILPHVAAETRDLLQLCEAASVILAHQGHVPSAIASEVLDVPLICIELYPWLSREQGQAELGLVGPRMDSALLRDLLAERFDDELNSVRVRFGLGRQERIVTQSVPGVAAGTATLLSRHLYPEFHAVDHPLSGYPDWEPPSWSAPAWLDAHLAHGGVVAVTFGSLSRAEQDGRWETLRSAIQRLGLRGLALAAAPWVAGEADAGPFASLQFASLDYVLPKVDLVIHHGGLGTSHRVAGAGKPSLTIPQAFDQFVNAHQLAMLGAAPRPLRMTEALEVRSLTMAIAAAMERRIAKTAEGLGTLLCHEDGARTAARLVIDQLAGGLDSNEHAVRDHCTPPTVRR